MNTRKKVKKTTHRMEKYLQIISNLSTYIDIHIDMNSQLNYKIVQFKNG